jgi:hypothetical protein
MTAAVGIPSRPLQYARAIARSGLPTGARATCWAIGSFANNTTGRAFPTVRAIAKATGLSEPVVSKHTAIAESHGFLHKERRYNGSIIYTITVPSEGGDYGGEAPSMPVDVMDSPSTAPLPPWVDANIRMWPQMPA